MSIKPRYWVYIHDLDGDLVEDLGDFEEDYLNDAIAEVLGYNYRLPLELVGRVVDYNLDSQTIYIVGPISYMKEYFDAQR